MAAPTDPDEVAWYERGPGMGVPGNAVFAGARQLGRPAARPSACSNGWSRRRDPGDRRPGARLRVRGRVVALGAGRGRADRGDLRRTDEPVITLITCGGEYVASRREYLDRLIVRAKGA